MGVIDSPVCLHDAKFRRDVDRLHSLGARVLAEFLTELGADSLRTVDIERRLERYAGLDPDAVRLAGGDQFPPRPTLRIVGARHATR